MGLTGFQKVRRSAEENDSPIAEIAQEKAIADQSPDSPLVDVAVEPESDRPISQSDRTAELKALNWDDLKVLLESYGLPINKPKTVSWDAFAIPQILRYEGF